ncbi:hypothetical protein SLEP1_g24211 [Rubroshorea leprosula]|uniref:Uncharacterized protein n=1 Tax=Rubroshorea leprosula TaxID=152421 RepID=A0AAV5JKW8_9ROSI|nr:hypothetical protein SLEP1_g24211 [Rubroshorea leprosula]
MKRLTFLNLSHDDFPVPDLSVSGRKNLGKHSFPLSFLGFQYVKLCSEGLEIKIFTFKHV